MNVKEEARLLNSPQLLKFCLRQFVQKSDSSQFREEIQKALRHEIFHRSSHEIHQIEGLYQQIFKDSSSLSLWKILHFLSRRYFRWSYHLGLPVLKPKRVLEFQWLLGEIWSDHLWLFALVYELEFEAPEPRTHINPAWREYLLPPVDDPLLLKLKERGLSEIHRHFNGSALPVFLWEEFVSDPVAFWRDAFHPLHRKEIEKLLPPEVSFEDFRMWCYFAPCIRRILEIYNCEALKNKREEFLKKLQIILSIYDKHPTTLSIFSECLSEENLGRSFASFRSRLSEREFLLGCYQTLPEAPQEYQLLLYIYLLIQNNWLRTVVMGRDQKGFERFYEFSQSRVREDLENTNLWKRFFQAQRFGGVRRLELRISPHEKFLKFYRKLDRLERVINGNIRRMLLPSERLDLTEEKRPIIEAGCIIHFIKQPNEICHLVHKDGFCLPRHFSLRKTLWRQARNIRLLKLSPRFRYFICGLDAASNELFAGPEVFSPMIRFLRKKVSECGLPWDHQRTTPLNLTFHAGESFRHILSGLRYIDECLEFLEMEAGDRLGHALALGIDPEKWAQKSGWRCYLPQGEWLDNLIWFKHQLQALEDFEGLILQIEDEIENFLAKIYDSRFKSEDLFKMWQYLRKEDPLLLLYNFDLPVIQAYWLKKAMQKAGKDAYELWRRYHLSPECRQKYEEIVEVSIDKSWLPAIKAVQNRLLEKIVDKRIIIEVNPTSNLSINIFSSLAEHPIFDWYPPVRDPSRKYPWVVVGSDDPGIFQTELWHEYIFLSYAAEERGYSPQAIDKWLDELVEYSRRFSFVISPE